MYRIYCILSAVESCLCQGRDGELGVTGEGSLLENAHGKSTALLLSNELFHWSRQDSGRFTKSFNATRLLMMSGNRFLYIQGSPIQQTIFTVNSWYNGTQTSIEITVGELHFFFWGGRVCCIKFLQLRQFVLFIVSSIAPQKLNNMF